MRFTVRIAASFAAVVTALLSLHAPTAVARIMQKHEVRAMQERAAEHIARHRRTHGKRITANVKNITFSNPAASRERYSCVLTYDGAQRSGDSILRRRKVNT
jgi:hypothetical protein